MQKLINTYRAMDNAERDTTLARAKLQAYIFKHPMAVCLLDVGDLEYLRYHEFKL